MAGGAARVRRYVDGDAHEVRVEGESGAYCQEREVTLLWRGDPIASAGAAGGSVVALDALSAGADGPCSVVCRSGLVTDLADVHALCRLPGCACPCHAVITASGKPDDPDVTAEQPC
ncbi:hypothetical protein SSIG_08033 [Streptomyces filamentosus NRRL 11379]|uniref:Predicted protein n=1 Tax=Streptomyces filamentosus NRRL 15998 TaxID=457431 RepID=D6ADJ0_STRFL|nr:predicted protein [Streptomyces filamentosus NRRL 15998]EWS93646.1 hypothetical protein SSIG_08033 [Streptomyces filamentosus NRRL 11379]